MKKKFLLFSLVLLALVFQVKADEVSDKLANLQRQINELKKQTSSGSSPSGLSLPEIHGRLTVVHNTFDMGSGVDRRNSTLFDGMDTGANPKNDTSIYQGIISFSGDVGAGFGYFLELKTNDTSNVKMRAASLYYAKGNSTIYIGRFFTPEFMENDQAGPSYGSNDFSEWLNWLPASLADGIHYQYIADRFGFMASLVGRDNDDANRSNERYAIVGRMYGTPIKNKNFLLHLGVDGGYTRYKKDDGNTYTTYTNMGEQNFGNEFGLPYSKSAQMINKISWVGGEVAFQFLSITSQTEFGKKYTMLSPEYSNFLGVSNGYYGSTGLTTQLYIGLTGEKREYSNSGSFNYLTVKNPLGKGGFGAFELYGRYSRWNDKDTRNKRVLYSSMYWKEDDSQILAQRLTGNDDYVTPQEPNSGYLYTVGLNWFPIDNIMFLANYSYVKQSSGLVAKQEINNITPDYVNGGWKYATNSDTYGIYRIEARIHF